MSLRTAAFFALIGTFLLTVLLLAGFIRDVSSVMNGLIPAVRILASFIYLLASLGVAVFFYVFYKSQP